jgi:indolepyruvate ferredoxin oxidoreductase
VTIPKIDFDLDAKYRITDGAILLTGVQALVRVVFDQLRADHRRGVNTAAFVSGYPGSPLGGFDIALSQSGSILDELGVKWIPGINEDLAAASVWGSQQDNLAPLKEHDGVIGMWYGKAPGVDRSGDAFRHANLHGPGRNGGVVCAVGDDPQSKSSTLPSASEIALYDAGMVVLAPGTGQEILDLGRHGFEISRYSGCWSALKIVTAVADGFGTASVHPDRITPRHPDLSFDGVPWQFRQIPRLFLPDTVALEAELFSKRHVAATAYARENGIDVIEVDPADAWITIVSYGHTYREVRQALEDLGLADDDAVRASGIRLLRLGMITPLEPTIVRRAASGVEELLVVEDKRSFVEQAVRDLLYSDTVRPRVTGKRDEHDRPLVPIDGEMTADRIRPVLAARLRTRLPDLPGEPAIRTSIPVTLTGPARSPSR